MSYQNYLPEDEQIIHRLEIRSSDKSTLSEILGVTPKRVFHLKNEKGFARKYRDIPLDKIEYLENVWKGKNIVLLVISIILLFIGIVFLMNIYLFIVGIPFLIVGIILLIKALTRKGGYFLINDDGWKFEFKNQNVIKTIEKIIQDIYNM